MNGWPSALPSSLFRCLVAVHGMNTLPSGNRQCTVFTVHLSGQATKGEGGGGGKGWASKKKKLFLKLKKKKKKVPQRMWPCYARGGGGGMALVAATKKTFFCGFPNLTFPYF